MTKFDEKAFRRDLKRWLREQRRLAVTRERAAVKTYNYGAAAEEYGQVAAFRLALLYTERWQPVKRKNTK